MVALPASVDTRFTPVSINGRFVAEDELFVKISEGPARLAVSLRDGAPGLSPELRPLKIHSEDGRTNDARGMIHIDLNESFVSKALSTDRNAIQGRRDLIDRVRREY